jgi:membrane protein implicated in regulation of membrane protease activity
MSPFRPDRSRRSEDRLLGQKMLVFVLGAVIALAGLATERDWLVYAALLLLLLGLAMRFVGRHTPADEAALDDDESLEDDVSLEDEAAIAEEVPREDEASHDDDEAARW